MEVIQVPPEKTRKGLLESRFPRRHAQVRRQAGGGRGQRDWPGRALHGGHWERWGLGFVKLVSGTCERKAVRSAMIQVYSGEV